MAMEVNSIYSNYADSYTNSANGKKQVTEETGTAGETKETNGTARKTAADELSYLSSKYSNYSFLAANYTRGMQYGTSTTVNVAISPQFLDKMANDPELEKEYERNIAAMQEIDERLISQEAAKGWRLETGWAIDKDGGISKWMIGTKDPNAKSYIQKFSENAERIKEKNAAKKEQQKALEEKRQAGREEKAELRDKIKETSKAQFGDKFKDAIVISEDDKNTAMSKAAGKDNAAAAGMNLDIKA